MAVSKGLGTTCRILAWAAIGGALIWPAAVVLHFLDPDYLHARGANSAIEVLQLLSGAIPLEDRVLALACYAVPTAMAVWGLFSLARLFRSFARGEVFSPAALGALDHIAIAIALNVATSFVAQLPISYFLTRNYPGHHGSLSLGIPDFVLLFVAGATYVVARVIAEAKRVADENASFV
jgi:hypothetical protein